MSWLTITALALLLAAYLIAMRTNIVLNRRIQKMIQDAESDYNFNQHLLVMMCNTFKRQAQRSNRNWETPGLMQQRIEHLADQYITIYTRFDQQPEDV